MSFLSRTLRGFKQRFPRLAWSLRWLQPSRWSERRRYVGKTTREVFELIYRENIWNSKESHSGRGSTMTATVQLREALPGVLAELKIQTLLDAPCGDFWWMRHCDMGAVRYIGADIVPELVREAQARFGSAVRTFIQLDLTVDPLPEADALFCRDCFLHLTLEQGVAVLDNFVRSGARYLIASTYRDTRVNVGGFTGGVRMVNLCEPPFSLPEPLRYLDDRGETQFDRCMGVWTAEQVASARRNVRRAGVVQSTNS